MDPIQLEAWVLDIVDRVARNQPIEDCRVELKGEWIDPRKAARRIAGHANASQGLPVLWIIGIDEKHGVLGANQNEMASWLGKVFSEFDQLMPAVLDLVVPVGELSVVAFLIDTQRLPFVVKNPNSGEPGAGPVSHEVPWREGTSIRSARREDLVRLLAPIALEPLVEILSGKLFARGSNNFREGRIDGPEEGRPGSWHLELDLYLVPQRGERITIPFHAAEVEIRMEGLRPNRFEKITICPPDQYSSSPRRPLIHAEASEYELVVLGPCRLRLVARRSENPLCALPEQIGEVAVRLQHAESFRHFAFAAQIAGADFSFNVEASASPGFDRAR